MGRRTPTDDGLAVVISVDCVLLNVMEHEGAGHTKFNDEGRRHPGPRGCLDGFTTLCSENCR